MIYVELQCRGTAKVFFQIECNQLLRERATFLCWSVLHSVKGVQKEVENNLLQLDTVAPDRWKGTAEFARDTDVVLYGVAVGQQLTV